MASRSYPERHPGAMAIHTPTVIPEAGRSKGSRTRPSGISNEQSLEIPDTRVPIASQCPRSGMTFRGDEREEPQLSPGLFAFRNSLTHYAAAIARAGSLNLLSPAAPRALMANQQKVPGCRQFTSLKKS